MKVYAIENHPNDSRVTIDPAGIVQTLSSRMGTGGNNTPFVLIKEHDEGTTMTEAYCTGNGQLHQMNMTTVMDTLDCMHDQKMILHETEDDSLEKKYVLRRLTPTECARLQGFPDWWCDGANGSDSAQYKLWGNGIALPCAVMIFQNIVDDAMKGENK